MSALGFTAIDFETANSYRGSPCSVGLVKVRDGHIVDRHHALIHPPERYSHFDGFNTWLHGISAEDVRDAPPWRDALAMISDFAEGDPLVSHNAAFDIGVIRYACIADEIYWPTLDFLCSLVLARRAFRLLSYRLPYVADACGVVLGTHHNADDDACAAAGIIVAMARAKGVECLTALAGAYGVHIGHMETGTYLPSIRIGRGLVRPDANPEADPNHPYYGRVLVFTGALLSLTRQFAWEEVTRVGGVPEPSVTKRTNILVIGDINPAVLAPGMEITRRLARVFKLQAKGQDIEMMTEDDFFRSL